MSRSPLAYPLTRGIDGDSGGAADLQTDIMRFMAILGLCLVAIFALVQSLPIAPAVPLAASEAQAVAQPPTELWTEPTVTQPEPLPAAKAAPASDNESTTPKPVKQPELVRPRPATPAKQEPVPLQRPKWTPKYASTPATEPPAVAAPPVAPSKMPAATESLKPEGFTLRFESDIALTRLVAAGQIGFYAIEPGRAQRMAVSDSRISFWDASTPNAFHQMEAATVPRVVVDALARTGTGTASVDWGVTLPTRLSDQLAQLMASHEGGALIIAADGNLRLESS
ncbi:MAG: hypothetical protein KJO82_03435 [Gammaproteobacteria bacterium]|nr:hypothetical protein [Gammaproteobacteria bacterium]NNC76401.1 hypothetical protein [Woeseiaceae bacterium]